MNYRKTLMLLDIDRRYVAAKLGLSYGALNRRLNGFCSFPEERQLQRIIEKHVGGNDTSGTDGVRNAELTPRMDGRIQ